MPSDPNDFDAVQSHIRNATWFKSSRSLYNGNCVEAARLPDGNWAVRDSKNKASGVLVFSTGEWETFVSGVKSEEFNA